MKKRRLFLYYQKLPLYYLHYVVSLIVFSLYFEYFIAFNRGIDDLVHMTNAQFHTRFLGCTVLKC